MTKEKRVKERKLLSKPIWQKVPKMIKANYNSKLNYSTPRVGLIKIQGFSVAT